MNFQKYQVALVLRWHSFQEKVPFLSTHWSLLSQTGIYLRTLFNSLISMKEGAGGIIGLKREETTPT